MSLYSVETSHELWRYQFVNNDSYWMSAIGGSFDVMVREIQIYNLMPVASYGSCC